jgi:hypothetical protein
LGVVCEPQDAFYEKTEQRLFWNDGGESCVA